MRIAVIGCGAMGAIYAARLANGGHDVVAVDTRGAHIEAIQRDGLVVDGPDGQIRARNVTASTDIAAAAGADLFIIATKAAGVAPAAEAVAGVMGPESAVLTIQNGLGSGDRIAAHIPRDRILLGVAEGFGAAITGPGHVRHTAMKRLRLGEIGGGPSPRLEAIAEAWRAGGFDVATYDDITQLIWEKFLCNVTLSAPCTVFDCSVAELMAHPDRWAVALGCTREAWAVGLAEGVAFSFDDPVTHVTAFAEAVGDACPSMLQDHRAKRISELDAINGQVPVLGARHGIATPYNDTLCAVIRAREARF